MIADLFANIQILQYTLFCIYLDRVTFMGILVMDILDIGSVKYFEYWVVRVEG